MAAGKFGLLAGTALALLACAQANAQTATELPMRAPHSARPALPYDVKHFSPPPAPPPPVDDGLGTRGFYLEADTLVRDDSHNTWTARGKVEARYQGRTLRGDEVIYDVSTGVVTANGHAQIISADGTAQFADHVVLDDQMRAGFARGFSASMQHNVRFAADVAIRRSETVYELNRAIFTPCDVCNANGSPKTPSWSIQASKIVQDHERHLVYYSNAVILVKGIPVFYAPIFWHPDPDSPRQSGLLLPRVANTERRGFSYEQPWLQILSPSAQLIVSPQFNTLQNPLLNGIWKQQFYSGLLQARFGYTYSRDFDGSGKQFGQDTSRSYMVADGSFAVTPDWTWGVLAQRTSDRLLFEKYDVTNIYDAAGLFAPDSQKLTSQLYTTRQDRNSYISISAISFQGLQVTDNNRALPLVAPLIEARFTPAQDILGGRLRIVGDGVLLSRDESQINPLAPGTDTRRASLEFNWLRTVTLDNGMRLEPFADVRGDLYNVANLNAMATPARTTTRDSDTLGVNFSWPFVRKGVGETVILEPIGYDVYDGGARLNLGGRATVDWGDGLDARALLGRAFRAQNTDIYPPNTGLNRTSSDWVVAADATPLAGTSFFGRALIDDQLRSDRLEVGVDFAYTRARGYLRYLSDNTQLNGPLHDFDGAGEFFLTRHWGVSLVGIRDMELNVWRLRDIGLVYKDECIRVELVYQHEDVIQGRLGASDTVFLRLNLATLGDQGYHNADFP